MTIDHAKLARLKLENEVRQSGLRGTMILYRETREDVAAQRYSIRSGLSRDAANRWESEGCDPHILLALDAGEIKRIGASVPQLHDLAAAMDRLDSLAKSVETLTAAADPFARIVQRLTAYVKEQAT